MLGMLPVTTARYTIEVVMSEEDPRVGVDPDAAHLERISDFAREFQRAVTDGYFSDLRYDTLDFRVVDRQVLDTQEIEE